MPAVLTHLSTMLLARERLANIRDLLQAKKAGGRTVTDLEHRICYLAGKAHGMMSEALWDLPEIAYPTGDSYTTPLGRGTSRYAVMGCMGPDLTAYSALLAPNQAWVFDTVHKGSPDHHREAVVAKTTDLALEIWRLAAQAIGNRSGENSTETAKNDARKKMQGYVLGHLCHVVADVISHPFVKDLEWHVGTNSRKEIAHAKNEGHMDAKIAQQVFKRESTRAGQGWSAWWPDPSDVPDELFAAYEEALEQIYRVRSARPAGYGRFEERAGRLGLPVLDGNFVKDGFSVFNTGALNMIYGWGYWNWWGFLLPAALPLMALFPLAMALPRGRRFYSKGFADVDDERAYFEVYMLPMAVTSIIPLFYGIWIAAVTNRGVGGITAAGLTFSILSFIASVTFFATLGTEDVPAWLRWILLFGIPVGAGLAFSITGLTLYKQEKETKRSAVLALIYAIPFIVSLIFALLYLLVMGPSGVAGEALYWIILVLFTVAVGVLWFLGAKWARDAMIPENPEPFPVDRPHFVRLFDDTTLHHAPTVPEPKLNDRFYPSGTRELITLWWDGDGDMYVRSRSTYLELTFDVDAAESAFQRVPAPMTPMSAPEYIDFLTRTVKSQSNVTGHLKGAVVYAGDLAYELPPGAVFADEADAYEAEKEKDIDNAAAHDEKAREFKKLKTSQEDADYILRHAPKPLQAVRFGRLGPVPFDPRENLNVLGAGEIESNGTSITGEGTLFSSFFRKGDQIRANGQTRNVTAVTSDTALETSEAFTPNIESAIGYERVSSDQEMNEGYTYVMDPSTQYLGGDSVMDYVADLSALICLGATPHLLKSTEMQVPSLHGKTAGGSPVSGAVNKVYQVFRSWNLDSRRVNEWRMLIAGGAVSEKGGAAESYDATMPRFPTKPDGWDGRDAVYTSHAEEGERTASAQGWVPLLRKWLSISALGADHDLNGVDPNHREEGPHSPTNSELSAAMAFLLDMPSPVTLDEP